MVICIRVTEGAPLLREGVAAASGGVVSAVSGSVGHMSLWDEVMVVLWGRGGGATNVVLGQVHADVQWRGHAASGRGVAGIRANVGYGGTPGKARLCS
jgi:hypothetical protein